MRRFPGADSSPNSGSGTPSAARAAGDGRLPPIDDGHADPPGRRGINPSPPQREAGDVVELGASARERAYRGLDARSPLRCARAVPLFGQQTFEAILPELERVRVL